MCGAFGGAALAVGAGFGGVGIKGKADRERKRPQNECKSSLQGQLDNAKTAGTISTISFGVGAAGLILGTVLYFTAGPSSPERSAHARATRIVPHPWVGLNQTGVAGDF